MRACIGMQREVVDWKLIQHAPGGVDLDEVRSSEAELVKKLELCCRSILFVLS